LKIVADSGCGWQEPRLIKTGRAGEPPPDETAKSIVETTPEMFFSRGQRNHWAIFKIHGELLSVPKDTERAIAKSGHVRLEIDSPGGDVHAALALLDLLRGKVVSTHATYAGSASAFLLALAPGKRSIAKDGSVMLHPPSAAVVGTSQDLMREARRVQELTDHLVGRLVERTGQPRGTVEAWLSGPDVRFTAEQSLGLGLVDQVS